MDRFASLAACSVVSKNHLAYARVACAAFLRHHPGARFFVLLADRNDGEFFPEREPFTLVELEKLDLPDRERLCFQYNILELNCAGKPYLLRHVLRQPGVSRVLYLDSDTFVYRELSEALSLLERHSIVLTPHLVGAVDDDGRRPGERDVLDSGAYNAGFLGLRNDAQVAGFLDWWSRRCHDFCVDDVRQGLFVDQRWLDLVPGLFADVAILRHPGYNVGHWGLPHRTLTAEDGGFRVNGQPLAFFHFSGLEVDGPQIISKHQNRYTLADVPHIAPLFEDYVARVKEAGYALCQLFPYGYARFDNGTPIPRDARRLFWSLGEGGRRFGNPFRTAGAGSFWNWLREDAVAGTGISRLWHHVHAARPELLRRFPDLFGRDRQAYLAWIADRGRWELQVPEALVPSGPPLAVPLPFGRPRLGARPDLPGVNVTGHARSEKGMGEVLRSMVRGLEAAAIPHAVVDLEDQGSANRDRTLVGLQRENPYPVNLIHLNADGLPGVVQVLGAPFFRGRHNIGYWLWEQPEFPEKYHPGFAYLDEVWVASDYCLEALARVSPIPVVKVPPPLPEEGLRTRGVGRGYFGLDERQRVFLFMFDAHSIVERKNPRGLIRAFKRAFPDDPDARLVLKVVHAPRALLDGLADEAGDPRVVIIDRLLERDEVNSLLELSDCYVSLHRSEGFGLTLAEAMALGKPVIATGYSANLDFMNVGNSLLVRHQVVTLDRDHAPYPRGSTWAEPDLEHAAELMRAVAADPERARLLGQRARADVMAYLSPAAAGARIAGRLALVGRDPEAPGSVFRT